MLFHVDLFELPLFELFCVPLWVHFLSSFSPSRRPSSWRPDTAHLVELAMDKATRNSPCPFKCVASLQTLLKLEKPKQFRLKVSEFEKVESFWLGKCSCIAYISIPYYVVRSLESNEKRCLPNTDTWLPLRFLICVALSFNNETAKKIF